MHQLVMRSPDFIGFTDACATGMGGVWSSGNKQLDNIVWRFQFPPDIAAEVVSTKNPKERLTNSDLEMAAALVHFAVLASNTSLKDASSLIYSDNSPTVAWCSRMADKSKSKIAGRLLRGFAMLQRKIHSSPVLVLHVGGDDNKMADFASRCYNTPLRNATNTEFLSTFNKFFPQQDGIWKTADLPTETISVVIKCLRGRRLEMQEWTTPSVSTIGGIGSPTASCPTPPPTLLAFPNRKNTKCSSVLRHGSGRVCSEMEKKCEWDRWMSLCGM